jgi:hypothetical protein
MRRQDDPFMRYRSCDGCFSDTAVLGNDAFSLLGDRLGVPPATTAQRNALSDEALAR